MSTTYNLPTTTYHFVEKNQSWCEVLGEILIVYNLQSTNYYLPLF
ncbi:hypothetical protein [Okeania sp. SIO2C9]|nr:hypothetical protein [Okeania sp. SIO2C9]